MLISPVPIVSFPSLSLSLSAQLPLPHCVRARTNERTNGDNTRSVRMSSSSNLSHAQRALLQETPGRADGGRDRGSSSSSSGSVSSDEDVQGGEQSSGTAEPTLVGLADQPLYSPPPVSMPPPFSAATLASLGSSPSRSRNNNNNNNRSSTSNGHPPPSHHHHPPRSMPSLTVDLTGVSAPSTPVAPSTRSNAAASLAGYGSTNHGYGSGALARVGGGGGAVGGGGGSGMAFQAALDASQSMLLCSPAGGLNLRASPYNGGGSGSVLTPPHASQYGQFLSAN